MTRGCGDSGDGGLTVGGEEGQDGRVQSPSACESQVAPTRRGPPPSVTPAQVLRVLHDATAKGDPLSLFEIADELNRTAECTVSVSKLKLIVRAFDDDGLVMITDRPQVDRYGKPYPGRPTFTYSLTASGEAALVAGYSMPSQGRRDRLGPPAPVKVTAPSLDTSDDWEQFP